MGKWGGAQTACPEPVLGLQPMRPPPAPGAVGTRAATLLPSAAVLLQRLRPFHVSEAAGPAVVRETAVGVAGQARGTLGHLLQWPRPPA